MKRCCLYLLFLILGALALGILVFALLRTDVLSLSPGTSSAVAFFSAAAAAGLGGLLAFLLGMLRCCERSPALTDAWLCCGEASAAGAAGALLTALITSLSAASGIGFHIGIALCSAFLLLMAGGLLCFLRRYVTACYCCRQGC